MLLNPTFLKLNKTSLFFTLLCLVLYTWFGYYLERTDYTKLIILYTLLFFIFYKLIQLNKVDFKFLIVVSVLFRLVFIIAIPNLSQDFYRFIWDGRMLLEGFNPYLTTPESYLINNEFPIDQAQELYAGMGTLNGSHYTNYPPINQLCFLIAALFAKSSILGSVIIMRLIIIVADIGIIYFGKQLLAKLNLPINNIFWYAVNPFIIIELTGNLHFEAVMLFFLIWSLYLLYFGKWQWAAVVFALSISVKLIPLIFLPLLWQWFTSKPNRKSIMLNVISKASEKPNNKIKVENDKILNQVQGDKKIGMTKLIGFYCIVGFIILTLFAPFYSLEFITNYTETVALWFKNFEFNASLYYITREIGYWITGYNQIAIIGKISSIIVLIFVVLLTFFRTNKSMIQLITAMLFVLTFYYFTATTVHPWYIATLVILSVFTKYKFPLVWSFIIVLSYLAYLNSNKADKSENLWIITLEYTIVYGVFIWEVFLKKPLGNKHIDHLNQN